MYGKESAQLSTMSSRGRAIAIFFFVAISLGAAPAILADTQAVVPTSLVELPNTDGYGLLAKPPAYSEAEMAALFAEGKAACESECITPFGETLGVADGAEALSNCRSTCINPEYTFLDLTSGEVTVHQSDPEDTNLHYIGVTYQCVEYVRKWWMNNLGITFGSIDSAHELIYLTEGDDIRSDKKVPLARSINGTAQRPPQRGDLVVYYPDRAVPEWRHGHNAVVVDVDTEQGIVSLGEENYDNEPWENPKRYSRQIRLFQVGGRYTLLDIPAAGGDNPDGGQISGWIYPFESL